MTFDIPNLSGFVDFFEKVLRAYSILSEGETLQTVETRIRVAELSHTESTGKIRRARGIGALTNSFFGECEASEKSR